MSLAPAGSGFRHVFIVSAAALLFAIVAAALLDRDLIWFGLATAVLFNAMRTQVASSSVAPSIAAGALAALLAAHACRTKGLAPMLILGIVVGLSASIRIPNLFLGVGAGLVVAFDFMRSREPRDFGRAAMLAGGALLGLAPVFAANAINAGSIFATTYSPADAESVISASVIGNAFRVIFLDGSFGAYANALAAAMGIAALLKRPNAAQVGAYLSFLLLLAMLATKPIVNAYYLLPVSAFVIVTCLLPRRLREVRASAALATIPAAALLAWMSAQTYVDYPSDVDEAVKREFSPDAIVWEDVFAGYFIMRDGVYAAKLPFASPDVQDVLIEKARAAGLKQLFSTSTPAMQSIVERLGARLSYVGKAHGQHVYKLAD